MNHILDDNDEEIKNEEVIHKINENTVILVEDMTEEYAVVRHNISEGS